MIHPALLIMPGGSPYGSPRLHRVEPTEWLVGESEAEVIEFLMEGSSCDVSFQEGASYLIYGNRVGDRYSTHQCTRTRLLEDAAFDLAVFRGEPEALKPVSLEVDLDGKTLNLSVTGGFGRYWILESSQDLKVWTQKSEFASVFPEVWVFETRSRSSNGALFFRVREYEFDNGG